MSNYNSLKTTIDANIKQNGNQEITGQILNSVLNQMVTTMGAGYQFAGVATLDPATDPGTPDAKVFYIANGKGKYEKFGGINVTEDDVVVLYWDSAWHKVATGIASQAKLSELGQRTEDITNVLGGVIVTSLNLFDSALWEQGGYSSTNGKKVVNNTRCRTINKIKFTPDSYISPTEFVSGGKNLLCYIYDKDEGFIAYGNTEDGLTLDMNRNKSFRMSYLLEKYPNAVYVSFMCPATGDVNDLQTLFEKASKDTLFVTERKEGLIDDVAKNAEDIENLKNSIVTSEGLKVTKSGINLKFENGNNYIEALLHKGYSNDVFNFRNTCYGGLIDNDDDGVSPMHVLNTTIGANHGQPCWDGTSTSHGLTSADVGKWWTSTDGTRYCLISIENADTLRFLSENKGTETNPTYVELNVGTLTSGGKSVNIESTVQGTLQQMRPAIGNQSQILKNSNGEAIYGDGTYISSYFDVVEEYDIFTPDSIVRNLVANVGHNDEKPIYTGDAFFHVENTYRFLPNMSVIVVATYTSMMDGISFQNIMFSQSAHLHDVMSETKVYVPNSLPSFGHDLRKPTIVNWTTGTNSFVASESENGKPVNRIMKYYGDIGFALGYITDFGVGKDLASYTNKTFEIRGNSGKIYPHGVDSGNDSIPVILGKDESFTAVMYRCFFDGSNPSSARMSMYHFSLNDTEYVYLDYSASICDKVVLDDTFNGKKIELVESMNAVLKSDVYNQGFYVKANYVEGETCYLVARIVE